MGYEELYVPMLYIFCSVTAKPPPTTKKELNQFLNKIKC